MKKVLLFTGLALLVILFSTCDRQEEDKQPIACFNYSPSSPEVNDPIAFNSCSTDAQIYSWNFGDGSATSSDISPSHSYSSAGQFTVSLKVWNKNNVDEETQIVTVTSGEVTQPVACFNPSSTSVKIGVSITFTNCSTNATSYSWNLGDGTTSTETSPSHSYSTEGQYSVVLKAWNGTNFDEEAQIITITGGTTNDPVACFTMDPISANVNNDIYFYNCSQNATSYKWDFYNDGSVDFTDKDLIIYFSEPGTFDVKLTVVSSTGDENSVIHSIVINPGVFDPWVYDMDVRWATHYFNDFSSSGDWPEETTSDYSSIISDDVYSITNYTTGNYWTFWTNNASMPSSTENYDYEAYFKVIYDNGNYGDGIFWALDPDNFDYYFYVFSPYNSIGYYLAGQYASKTWTNWFCRMATGRIC